MIYLRQPEGVGFHPAFGRDVNYSIQSLPEDPDGQVRETIREALRYVRADATDAAVEEMAGRAAKLGNGDPLAGTWNLLKQTMRFRQDADIADDLQVEDTRKPDIIEVLIRPADQARLILLQSMGVEDCDGFNMFAASILTALGVPCSLVTIEADPERPNLFSHVYTAAYPNGYGQAPRVPLDFSHGDAIGDEPAMRLRSGRLPRLKEWRVFPSTSERLFTALIPIAILFAGYQGIRYLNRRQEP